MDPEKEGDTNACVSMGMYDRRGATPLGTLGLHKNTCFRDGETTIKIKFALLRGVGLGGREENRTKMLFFVGNATTIEI